MRPTPSQGETLTEGSEGKNKRSEKSMTDSGRSQIASTAGSGKSKAEIGGSRAGSGESQQAGGGESKAERLSRIPEDNREAIEKNDEMSGMFTIAFFGPNFLLMTGQIPPD